MISVEFSELEAISLAIAARAMILRYDLEHRIKEPAYLDLVRAYEHLEQAIWGPVNGDDSGNQS